MTTSPREAAELLARHGLAPRRALGQNFVVDPNTVRRIARLAGVGPGDRVVEIGAGLGALTEALVETGAAVTAIEVDHGLVGVLRERLAGRGVRIVEGDARRLDWDDVLGGTGGWVLVANLPYNVATPLVADLLDGVPSVQRMLVMVQREVGERLAARPGDDGYGAVSVKVAYWATASVVGKVPATVFLPRPEGGVRPRRHHPAPGARGRARGGPRAGCSPWCGPASASAARCCGGRWRRSSRPGDFEAAAIRPDARAEELDVADWGRLAAVVQAR